ncbi:hypothetical protein B296_00050837 [Ensete ventricosum]|uniref:Uncharacterized protein n=1 Tax=Ensete ventricosum TaxID=4639 RepID=A0A426XUC3_ENSVE|nr:hypothetical protein B296_00050837 [Ensete ventricosum]
MDAAWLEEICVNWGLISVEEGEISCCRGRRGLSSLREGYAAGRRRRRRGWEAATQVETSTAAVAEGHQNKGAPLFLALGGWWQRGATSTDLLGGSQVVEEEDDRERSLRSSWCRRGVAAIDCGEVAAADYWEAAILVLGADVDGRRPLGGSVDRCCVGGRNRCYVTEVSYRRLQWEDVDGELQRRQRRWLGCSLRSCG